MIGSVWIEKSVRTRGSEATRLATAVEARAQDCRKLPSFRLVTGEACHKLDRRDRLFERLGGNDLDSQPRSLHRDGRIAIPGARADDDKIGRRAR